MNKDTGQVYMTKEEIEAAIARCESIVPLTSIEKLFGGPVDVEELMDRKRFELRTLDRIAEPEEFFMPRGNQGVRTATAPVRRFKTRPKRRRY